MRILLVATGLGIGGAERQATDLASAMAEQGHNVCLAYLTGPILITPSHPHVRLEPLQIEKSVARAINGLGRLVLLIRRFKPDVVHSHMLHANLLCRLARILVSMPVLISSAHSSNEGGRLRMLMYRLTDRLADKSTNVSDAAVQAFVHLRAVTPNRMICIHNGIDCRRFAFDAQARERVRREHSAADRPVLLAVGRLTEAKDYPTLLRAFADSLRDHPDALLWIAGAGELKDLLANLVSKLGIESSILFLGARDDVPALLCAADIFVQSSRWEGFGLAVAEAMATERVVVSTSADGLAEVVGDEGYLTEPGDPDSLAARIRAALALTDEQACAMGSRARRRIQERFSLEAIVDRWLELYQDTGTR